MLKKYIETKDCFKLILGANNENFEEITKLVALYSTAGCNFFDINASKEAIIACKKGFEYSKRNGLICVSVGTKNDPHLAKCKITENMCINCKKCINVCIQDAIKTTEGKTTIDENKCIGCKKCCSVCNQNAINAYQKEIDFKKTVDSIKNDADCIEFHIVTQNKDEIFEKWDYLCSNYSGYLSIALNRLIFSDKDIKDILFKLIETRNEKVIIQADGAPMSGGADDYNTTLQAVATADIIRKSGINIPVLVSGGTNSKTRELALLCNVDIQGVAIGSWARKQVKEYINRDDFLENGEIFKKALEIAKCVVDSAKYLNI